MINSWKSGRKSALLIRPAGRLEIQKKIAEGSARRKELLKAAIPADIAANLAELRAARCQIDAQLAALPKPQYVYAAADYFEPIGTFRFAD